MGNVSPAMPSSSPRASMSQSSREAGRPDRWPRNAPRNAEAMEARIPHMVLTAPTSMAPTAMGRTTLYQTEKITSPVGGAAAPATCS